MNRLLPLPILILMTGGCSQHEARVPDQNLHSLGLAVTDCRAPAISSILLSTASDQESFEAAGQRRIGIAARIFGTKSNHRKKSLAAGC
jgi:hypothetical protein